MAEEEFQESEVIFSDGIDTNGHHYDRFPEIFHVSSKHGGRFISSAKTRNDNSNNSNKKMTMRKKKMMKNSNSVPVNIPDNVFRFGDDVDRDWSVDSDDDEEGDGEIVPPHVIVGRRLGGGNMAYSVCTGTGRTLKGRDLSKVRNSILRLTGFLET